MEHCGTQTIETERLILRQFRQEDGPEMFRSWASDPEVTRYLTWPPHPDAAHTGEILRKFIEQYRDPAYYNWCLVLKETGVPIGNLSVTGMREETRCAELGWCLSRSCWGQGLMPEAGRAVLEYLFYRVGFERVRAKHDRNNPKSGRVMEKLGMQYEGCLRKNGLNNQGIVDEVIYGILREEYICRTI